MRAVTVTGLLGPGDCQRIVDFAEVSSAWEPCAVPFWSGRIMGHDTVQRVDEAVAAIMRRAPRNTREILIEAYGLAHELYADTLTLVRWAPGSSQPPHADDMTNIAPHGSDAHRAFGTIIYLNDNFEGGETYYPQYGREIKPVRGMLACHPGTPDHLHGVTTVRGATRYTIASFWTFDAKKALAFEA